VYEGKKMKDEISFRPATFVTFYDDGVCKNINSYSNLKYKMISTLLKMNLNKNLFWGKV